MSKIQSIRGMNDLLPSDSYFWSKLEKIIFSTLVGYGYKEIRFPILESTALFNRAIGEVTDIVEKEMYTFNDKNGDSLTLRPEGTACCVRACEQHGLLYNQTQKLWYCGPMFRHERPQKGRLRQFHQVGVEAFGFSGPEIDCEMLSLTAKLWKNLGLADNVTLQINTLGSSESRACYKASLVDYLRPFYRDLDTDSQRRIVSNPLRIFDSKVEKTKEILSGAPLLYDYLDDKSKTDFDIICKTLTSIGVNFVVNSHLVRGLDYYNGIVFEWITNDLGSQGTVCAGGRYDGLVSQLGGKSTPAFGFAMGIERLALLISSLHEIEKPKDSDIYFVVDQSAFADALLLADLCRDALPSLIVQVYCGSGGFSTQFKNANKTGAKVAVIIGSKEISERHVQVKFLRDGGQQVEVPFDTLVEYLNKRLC